MYIVGSEAMHNIDRKMQSEYHVSSKELMLKSAMAIYKRMEQWRLRSQRIMIVCGPGNNGGDGFALSTLLKQAGYFHVVLFTLADETALSDDARYFYEKAKELNIAMYSGVETFTKMIVHYDICVDAIFGSGLACDVEGDYEQVIHIINASHIPCISIDIASGVDSDSGLIQNIAVEADVTICLANLKLGNILLPGKNYCGKIFVEDIGIVEAAYQEEQCFVNVDEQIAKSLLYNREQATHKGSFGKVLFIGGSHAMPGAVSLCAKSILRSGVGTLTLFVPDQIVFPLSLQMQECMFVPAKSDNGFFAQEALEQLKTCIHNYDLVVVGNGMGRNEISKQIVKLVLETDISCILDGDALYECGQMMDVLKQRTCPTILTPHPKELSYLLQCELEDVQQRPLQCIKMIQNDYISIIYKDYYSLICTNHKYSIVTNGSHALAKGGSGDVLCGIIAGLYAQSQDVYASLTVASFVHAKCAQELMKEEDANSILPSDLISQLSKVYKSLR